MSSKSGGPHECRSTKNFFISYTGQDQRWAEWIAWELECAGYSTEIQAWDFEPGARFVEEMDRATTMSERTIAVVSTAYCQSDFARAEWQEAFRSDPTGEGRRLLAFRIEDCKRPGLLGQLVSVDLFGISEDQARDQLIKTVQRGRRKPKIAPIFPGEQPIGLSPTFPGAPTTGSNHPERSIAAADASGKNGHANIRIGAIETANHPENSCEYPTYLLAQIGLPHHDPGTRTPWKKEAPDRSFLVMQGVTTGSDSTLSLTGYPFGTVPRLLICWMLNEAFRNDCPEIALSDNYASFMKLLYPRPTGGQFGTVNLVRRQMERLFHVDISITRPHLNGNSSTTYHLWESSNTLSDHWSHPPNCVKLSDEIFEEIIAHPPAYDTQNMLELRGSALRLDIYAWLICNTMNLKDPTVFPWDGLYPQFGTRMTDTRQQKNTFRKHFINHLKKVTDIVSASEISADNTGVRLYPRTG
ncbi:replication protein RepA [Nocardia yunnanensis]|uniref:replication protein RepA n=1 Tax=Nocardia yunnanensis TaxID=2382165 RepID=UPI001CA38DB4|nr:replication protein RepA [Nocardia yunnanensis]